MWTLAEVDWNSLLQQGPGLPIMVVFSLMATVAVVVIVAPQWRRVRLGEADARLKRQMIEQGYSAEEIKRILDCHSVHVDEADKTHEPRAGFAPVGSDPIQE